MNNEQKVALVTGGNRGLGFETCRQLGRQGFKVILSSRDIDKGKEKEDILRAEGLDVFAMQLDVTDPDNILTVKSKIEEKYKRLDVLINNAGLMLDPLPEKGKTPSKSLQQYQETFRDTMDVNVIGAFLMCEAFTTMMRRQNYGRIVNVSSILGQMSSISTGGFPAYRISKVGLNAVTLYFSSYFRGFNVLINSISTGWVKTDMGGYTATRSLEEGTQTIIWAATLPDNGPNGSFLHDKEPISW